MSDTPTNGTSPAGEPKRPAAFLVGSAPHLTDGATTRRIMFDVIVGLVPVFVAAALFFGSRCLVLTAATVAACLATEALANWMRRRPQGSLLDGSAIVTGAILALSLPPTLPATMAAIGGGVGIGLGKMIFGGLGQNLFNPAMVGRAFLMACFPVAMTTWVEARTLAPIRADAVTQATPLAAAKFHTGALAPLGDLFMGNVGGSLGETSALACLLGGLYLLARRTADWRQPVGMLAGVILFAAVAHWLSPARCAGVLYHLNSGALLFGAFFIATDYVGSPITPAGRLIFGFGAGLLTMLVRLYGGYPEGVMYAILMMNALSPLIERWTVPVPFGGKVPAQAG